MKTNLVLWLLLLSCLPSLLLASPVICINEIGYDTKMSKQAVLITESPLSGARRFELINALTKKSVFEGTAMPQGNFEQWGKKHYYRLDFSAVKTPGRYYLRTVASNTVNSATFAIGTELLARTTLPALLHYFRNQRANTAIEMEHDKSVQLFGSEKRVDLAGGWCDASGDVSKYFSHLAYSNFFSPQQIPLVTWSLADAADNMPALLNSLKLTDSIRDEARYGADYLLKSLSPEGYFYMIVFSYFNKDPNARRVVGLHANSVTTDEYQCAFREGGGMAIAALAKIARWKSIGTADQQKYLQGAKRAYAHLKVNNLKYCDDGKENIIDDYCALMAALELYQSTAENSYLQDARARVSALSKRMTARGYFISDDTSRPYFHASDTGLPLIALKKYMALEKDHRQATQAGRIFSANLNYQLQVSTAVVNPFGYARQTIQSAGKTADTFFIPHINETGWWWQGENARLASLAAVAFSAEKSHMNQNYALSQLNWILGCNPYQVCFMYGFGTNNVPYMASNYGHGSQKGGISNGITGGENEEMGRGIDFKHEAKGNEWRWTEQWLPHAAWFLQAITALQKE